MASDGSVHHAETLLAEALRGLAYAATAGRPLPPAAAITYPAHWRQSAVDALRRAIRQIPEWSAEEPVFIPDTTAALTALAANPGLPTRGVIALCDFGGSGTSITLVDGGTHIAPTLWKRVKGSPGGRRRRDAGRILARARRRAGDVTAP